MLTPDGRTLGYQIDDNGTNQADLLYRAVSGDTTPKPVSVTPFVETRPRLSRDGKWASYVTDASGATQVVVQPFPGPGPRVQVSSDAGTEPL